LVVTEEDLKGYLKSVQKTTVNSHGGPTVGNKISLTTWKNELKQNFVAIDRFGDLLFSVVNYRSLPELPKHVVNGVRNAVKNAVTRYYKMNTVKGCLNPESPNFEPLANIEGSCDAPLTNFSFGGVYQTCEEFRINFPDPLCGQAAQPSADQSLYRRLFVSGWLRTGKTVVKTYWCAVRPDRNLPSQSGALFGGAFSPRVDNPAGGGKACPASYKPYRIGRDITLCVSSDMTESARAARVPFGGLFTCNSGNPLAEPGRHIVSLKSNPHPHTLPPPPPPPHRCPEGFTQSALDIFNGCEIMQCTRALGTRGGSNRIAMSRLPPFEEPPEMSAWSDITNAKESVDGRSGGEHVVTSAVAVCITIGVAVALIVAACFAVFTVRRRRQRRGRWTEVSGTQPSSVEEAAGTEASSRQPLLGNGWDNLRNREMGPVADVSLSADCSLSVDGFYALPGQVLAYPIKESHVSLISKVIEHSTRQVAPSMLAAEALFGGLFGIGGQFSEEFQEVKETLLYSKTQVGRTQLRYKMYVARMLPDFRLSRVFKNRLVEIGKAVQQNLTNSARYLSDLLVRDFGTHVITSLDAGAVLEKLDYFQLDSLKEVHYTTNKITQCMSVSFFNFFSAGESSTLVVTDKELKDYQKSVQKTTVNAHGGPPVGDKINLTSWKNGLKQNFIAIDRLSVNGVRSAVKDAVTRYYTVNTVKGCLNPESPNFEPLANIEGSCDAPLTNFSFGGVYQTCEEFRTNFPDPLCGQAHSPVQINHFTGGYSCPDGYEPVIVLKLI
uniref:Macrophage-expressed gene 1 protein n=1 Tax=Macrostomum lignano TaxID=282301 RepID=A0A1I8HAW6_9PLAT